MRYLLAVALVLYLSGVPAAWAKSCPMAAVRGAHSCCLQQRGAGGQHLAASCGCQMAPAPAAPAPASTSAVPADTMADHGAPTVFVAGVYVAPACLADISSRAGPPVSSHDSSLSHLSGSGFRC